MRDRHDLSVPQLEALKWARYSDIGGNFYCASGTHGTKPTLRALQRKGYVKADRSEYRFWLTSLGEKTRDELVNETCAHCGHQTHMLESACLKCGKLKSWAKQ